MDALPPPPPRPPDRRCIDLYYFSDSGHDSLDACCSGMCSVARSGISLFVAKACLSSLFGMNIMLPNPNISPLSS